jgi:hypothetical protein
MRITWSRQQGAAHPSPLLLGVTTGQSGKDHPPGTRALTSKRYQHTLDRLIPYAEDYFLLNIWDWAMRTTAVFRHYGASRSADLMFSSPSGATSPPPVPPG